MKADVARAGSRLDLTGVGRRFGATVALDDVSMSVEPGSLTALLGPSGCGKTTLLRAIAGFEPIDRGRISLNGDDIVRTPLRERNVGFVFQGYALFPHLTVARNIAFGLEVRGTSKSIVGQRVRELLELVQLTDLGDRFPHQISGGQRQRVALARALAAEPKILLLDEPFGALDANVRRDLRTWIRTLHDELHLTTILVTHDAEEAMEIADQLVLLRDGRVEQSGAPMDLYRKPASPFVMTFFGPANALLENGDVRYVRPHEIQLACTYFPSSYAATVARIIELGSKRRFELAIDGAAVIHAETFDAGLADAKVGDTIYYAAAAQRTFGRRPE